MKNFLIIISIFLYISNIASAQSAEYNYIKTTTFLSENEEKKITSVSYFDALATPIQEILLDANSNRDDMVQIYEYDELGRQIKGFLPFVKSNESENFVLNAKDLQKSYYNTIYPAQNPYFEVKYDNSPLNRIVKKTQPGEEINSINFSVDYIPAGGITNWIVDNDNKLINAGIYLNNSLKKYIIKDEDDKEIIFYKNSSDKVILKEEDNRNIRTWFVYDKYDRLVYVISPEAENQMNGVQYDQNSEIIKQLCYYYKYDERHNVIIKQLPGKEPIYIIYDSKDRLRMEQDGNQRISNKWLFFNYDIFGRITSTGLGLIDGNEPIIEDTIVPSPIDGITSYLTYQYYDNYDFIEDINLIFDENFSYHLKFDRVKGKATGSKVRIMYNDREEWQNTAIYYDNKGRVIQTITQNHVGGYDIISYKYGFSGENLSTKHKHTNSIKDSKFLVYTFEYDNLGRLLKTYLSQHEDGSNPLLISENMYDDLGKLIKEKIHSEDGINFLQTIKLDYDIKGNIKKINDPNNLDGCLFAMELFYDNNIPGISHPVYEDGKISAIQWNSAKLINKRTYTYSYDSLNRLTSANYFPQSKFNVSITYDKNGNIQTLKRSGEIISKSYTVIGSEPMVLKTYGLIDNLSYTYLGNHLINVKDEVEEIETQLNNDFRELVDLPPYSLQDEYIYDANGNMKKDLNKGIIGIKYNHLNQPILIDYGNKRTEYLYTAEGLKLKSETYILKNLEKTIDYVGPYVYEGFNIKFINIPGGRIINITNEFQYHLTDHLGNVRVTFGKNSTGKAVILQEDHYYPFGLQMSGLHIGTSAVENNFLYNGKELQKQTNYYDYGFRQLDPQLGRWHTPDLMAEIYYSTSPYAYVQNNPINKIDYMGLWDEGFDSDMGPPEQQDASSTDTQFDWVVPCNAPRIDQFYENMSDISDREEWDIYPEGGDGDPPTGRASREKKFVHFENNPNQPSNILLTDFYGNIGTQEEFDRSSGNYTYSPAKEINKIFNGGNPYQKGGAPYLIGGLAKGSFSAINAFKNAISPFKGGLLTNVGRAVTKHPQYFGFKSTEALMKVYNSPQLLNNLGSNALKDILRNGVITTGAGGRYPNGWVTYTLPNGNAASWSMDGTFIGFRGLR